MIHTLQTHRGRGLAKRVVAYLTLKMLEAGGIPYCHISPSNAASIKVMESLGYERGETVAWIIAHKQ